MAQDNDIDELAVSVAERLRETPWEYYDSPDPRARETVHTHVREIREDLERIADVDPNRAIKVWDENVPDEYEARAALPDPDIEPDSEGNAIEPGQRRRRPSDEYLYEPESDGRREWHPSPVDGFSSLEAYEDAIGRTEDEGIAEVERRMRSEEQPDANGPKREDQPAPDQSAPADKIEVVTPALPTVAGPRIDHDQTIDDKPEKATPPSDPDVDIDPDGSHRSDRQKMLREGLEKRYLLADDKYHFRDEKHDVAFEAGEQRLTTRHDDAAVITGMLDLAEARGWSDLKLSGTKDFKREAWFQANARGIEVTGYTPDKLDQARLAEYRAEFPTPADRANVNVMEQEKAPPTSTPKARFDETTVPHEDEPKVDLSPGQRQVVSVLEKVMAERGDSPEAIAKVREIASERFVSNRVYVGKLVETGTAPYQDMKGEKPSHFVTLEDDEGKRTKVWGVDFPRALEDSGAVTGEKVVIAFGGRRQVTIDKDIKDESGKVIGTEKAEVMRNTWDIAKFDRLREDAKERVVQAAQSVDNPSKMTIFDNSAPSQRPSKQVPAERQRSQERAI